MNNRGLVFLFPGQGSQYVGMGRAFYQEYSEVRDLFERASETLQIDMQRLCFEGPENELILTDRVQPAITVVNLACRLVLELHGLRPAAAAGHSLGEYSALYAAGVVHEETVLRLVRWRGQRMQEAAGEQAGTMAAILGLDPARVGEICDACGIEMANYNSPAQIIVSGSRQGVAQAMELARSAGAKRWVPLQVSGAWHSRFMKPAQEKFRLDLERCTFDKPQIPVVSNVDADYVVDAARARENLARQLCSPVCWQESMERLLRDGYRHFIEVGPKRVLRGLLRQIDRNCPVYNVEDPVSLEACLAQLRE